VLANQHRTNIFFASFFLGMDMVFALGRQAGLVVVSAS
jgi:hypothetical protein